MIELTGVNKTYNYGKPNAFHALKDINLKIESGEMVAVTGRSGAGKSTLMHVIGCIDSFESGEYSIAGKPVSGMGEKGLAKLRNERIGIVMQDFALIDQYTVLENVMVPLYFSDCRSGAMKRMAMDKIEMMGLKDQAKKNVKNLSGGQKQRVAIARALVNEPSFILADEPTGALDSKTAEDIMNVFLELNRKGATIIIITHDMKVADLCSRRIVIEDGRIV